MDGAAPAGRRRDGRLCGDSAGPRPRPRPRPHRHHRMASTAMCALSPVPSLWAMRARWLFPVPGLRPLDPKRAAAEVLRTSGQPQYRQSRGSGCRGEPEPDKRAQAPTPPLWSHEDIPGDRGQDPVEEVETWGPGPDAACPRELLEGGRTYSAAPLSWVTASCLDPRGWNSSRRTARAWLGGRAGRCLRRSAFRGEVRRRKASDQSAIAT